jgi:hypothetical protein
MPSPAAGPACSRGPAIPGSCGAACNGGKELSAILDYFDRLVCGPIVREHAKAAKKFIEVHSKEKN